jgi:hypothetical protein
MKTCNHKPKASYFQCFIGSNGFGLKEKAVCKICRKELIPPRRFLVILKISSNISYGLILINALVSPYLHNRPLTILLSLLFVANFLIISPLIYYFFLYRNCE